MSTSIFKTIVAIVVFCSVNTFNTLKAQMSDNNIQEILLSNQDGFRELRNQLMTNFDFTNPNLQEGNIVSEIVFTIEEDGKFSNIRATSDCQYVSEELENTMKSLLLKIDPTTLSGNPLATKYILPVSLKIEK